MLFKEPKVESSFEKHREVFRRIVAETIEEIKERGHDIGEGKTASVRVSDLKDFICLKIVDYQKAKKNHVSLTNKVYNEIDYLDKLSDVKYLKSIGINKRIVPRPMYAQEVGDFGFMFMQKIEGLTIADWITGGAKTESLPADFNWENFFTELSDIMRKLNNNKIYHRDLHEGNIFIDDHGKPIIIDFGDARESFMTDENPYREESLRGVTIFKSDAQNITDIKKKILTNK